MRIPKYRIVCRVTDNSNIDDTYTVQKKSWLGFWYNFENYDACLTGVYYQMDRAKAAIDRDRSITTKTYESY